MLFPPQSQATTIEKGHGRIETRIINCLSLQPGQVSFPCAQQIFSIERLFTDYLGNIKSSEKIVGITSLSQNQAGPDRLLDLNRKHWTIENKIHYVRDVSMNEDASRIRKGNGPRLMATFKNLTMSFFRIAGSNKIAEKLLQFKLDKKSLFKFVGICAAIKN